MFYPHQIQSAWQWQFVTIPRRSKNIPILSQGIDLNSLTPFKHAEFLAPREHVHCIFIIIFSLFKIKALHLSTYFATVTNLLNKKNRSRNKICGQKWALTIISTTIRIPFKLKKTQKTQKIYVRVNSCQT